MSAQGLKVDVELGGASTMTFDEVSEALLTFVGQRVMVSIADTDNNACAGVGGVVARRLVLSDDEAEMGAITILDIGVDGVVIVSRTAFVGARWRCDDDGEYLALQSGGMLMTVRTADRKVT